MRLVALLCFVSLLLAADAVCPSSTGSRLWSQNYGSTAEGSDVTISGDTWLDVSPPPLGTITIPSGSGLYFQYRPATPLVLNATNILVYGSFCIGSTSTRYNGDATVVLSGAAAPGNLGTDNFGTKVIGVAAGATLGLYGEVKSAWTRLSANALRDFYTQKGPTSVSVTDSINWAASDVIAVASTDFLNQVQTERMTIASISSRTITLNSYLKFSHYGEVYVAGGGGDDFVDMRGEVGLLSHNVRITSAMKDDADTWGGHVHITGAASVQIDNTEFSSTGQTSANTAEQYRWSIFFDNAGDMPGSYVTGSSFHDTFKGAVGIAKTSNLLIKDNVAFNCSSHTFFLGALGVSQGLNFEHNLAMYGRTSEPYGTTYTSCFYMGYMNNTWTQNSAVECSIGFQVAVPDDTAAATAYGSDYWPRYISLGLWANNYAHGNTRDGLNMGNYQPRFFSLDAVRALNLTQPNLAAIRTIVQNRPVNPAIFSDFHAYKNQGTGAYGDGYVLQYQRMHFSDNRYGFNVYGTGILLENSVIIGDSPNVGTPLVADYEQTRSRPSPYSPSDPIYAVLLPSCCEPTFFANVRFYNFNDDVFKFIDLVRLAGAIAVDNGGGAMATESRFYKIGWSNVQRRVLLNPNYKADGIRQFALTDIDGSLSAGFTGGGCGATIVGVAPNMYTSSCSFQSQWNAYLCPPNDGLPAYRRFYIQDTSGVTANVTQADASGIITRLNDGASTLLDPAGSSGAYTLSYDTSLLVNAEYLLEFGTVGETPDSIVVNFYDYLLGNSYTAQGGEYIRLAVPFPANANFTVRYASNKFATVGTSRSQVSTTVYYWDSAAGLLWVGIGADKENFGYYNGIPWSETSRSITILADCPSGCTVPTNIPLPTGSATPGVPTFRRCLANNNGYLGWPNGVPSLSANGAVTDIFVDALAVGWATGDTNYLLTNALPFTPALSISGVGLWFNWTQYAGTGFGNSNGPAVGSNSHLSFQIRSDPASGVDGVFAIDPYVCVSDENNVQVCIDINNPWFVAGAPIDSNQWYTVYVPLADLGLTATNKINNIRFGHNQNRAVSVYVDEVRIGAYSVNWLASPSPITNAAAATTSGVGRSKKNKKAPVGAIVGGVIGGLIVIAIIVAVVVFLVMKGGCSHMKEFAARTTRNQPRWAA